MRRVYVGRISHHVRERDLERFFKPEGRIRDILMKDGFAFVEFEHLGDAEAAVRHLDGRDINGERVHVEFAKGPPRGRNGATGSRGGGNISFGRRDLPMRREGPNGGGMGSSSGGGRRDFRNDRGRERGDNHGGSRTGGGISYAEKYGPPRNTDFRIIVENLSSRVSWQDLKDLMRQVGEVTFADAHKRERNMGIVDFATLKDMRHAIEKLHDTEFMGRRIKVYEDKSRRRSNGGNSRRGGRSRSRSRGYSNSRSRSRDRPEASRSRSRDRPETSRSRSRDRPEASRSRSRSPITRHDSQMRPRSVSSSPVKREPQRSRSRSRSRSRNSSLSRERQSRSCSQSPVARERDAPSRSRSASG